MTVKDRITKHWDSFGSHCMSTVNFTTSILEMTAAPIQVEEPDDLAPQSPVFSDFVDASDTFPDVPSLHQQL
ncbi:hypothetical protein G6F24_012401 [Rhizopus arrhizus]|nr:hypothetical protein G6F24_012401 [Rhizopus arrhizus]